MLEQFKTLVWVFVGGGLGSCCRFLISKWLNPMTTLFPLGTLVSNVISCLVMGIFSVWAIRKIELSETLKILILVGFCGGFSTFSTFANELITLSRGGGWLRPIGYSLASIALGTASIGLGVYVGTKLINQ